MSECVCAGARVFLSLCVSVVGVCASVIVSVCCARARVFLRRCVLFLVCGCIVSATVFVVGVRVFQCVCLCKRESGRERV